jgi:hypothetical protein
MDHKMSIATDVFCSSDTTMNRHTSNADPFYYSDRRPRRQQPMKAVAKDEN